MEGIARALIYAVSYINHAATEEDDGRDRMREDVQALEDIASALERCTPEEQDALAHAAESLLREHGSTSDPWGRDLAHWMEETFVIGWRGNQRADADGSDP